MLFVFSFAAPLHSQTADSFNPGAGNTVYAFAVQADGNLLVGGAFGSLAGSTRNGLGRFHFDYGYDSLDTTFSPGITSPASTPVYCLSVQPDGKILVGGAFTNLTSKSRSRIARLNADGSLDPFFNSGADTNVYVMATQPDGKILVGGSFTTLSGVARAYLGRLNEDGSLDESFSPAINDSVYSLALQPDGKIIAGGNFTSAQGGRNKIARFHPDGSLDDDFDSEADEAVYCLALQADGKILAGGKFNTLGGLTRLHIGRLNTDGSIDADFHPEINGDVRTFAVQANGMILAGGSFDSVSGQSRSNIVRLNLDGTLDTFDPSASAAVYCLALQADGKLLAGGNFTSIGGSSRSRIARLNNNLPAVQSLTLEGSTISWQRGGSSPEASSASLAYSTNGLDWLDLSVPERVSGGWQLTGLALPSNATIRARAYLRGGYGSGSEWFVESGIGSPALSSQPSDRFVGTTAQVRFNVAPVGTGPFSYQWFRDGAALAGATRSFWTASPPSAQNAANAFEVLVSSSLGSIRSQPALLSSFGADSFNPGANSGVYAMALQPGGGLLVGGQFTVLASSQRNFIGRFRPDDALDTTFNPGANNSVFCLNVQPDEKILVGGAFTTLAGQSRSRIGRLNADGSLDTEFNPGADGNVNVCVVQSDGKILVGGSFATLTGQARKGIGRLNADGSLDAAFNPVMNFGTIVNCIALQPDGRILVGGQFSNLGGQSRQRIGRLNSDGSLDGSFNPNANGEVRSIVVQKDGRILVGGHFTTLGGQSCQRIGRLNVNGSLDLAFRPEANNTVRSIILQADGRILLAGAFGTLGGQTHMGVAQLHPDGTVDAIFNPSFTGDIHCLAPRKDGKVFAGGIFGNLWGISRSNIGRLNSSSRVTETLALENSTITWLRGGSSPEANRVSFEYWSGASWSALPAAERIAGGWRATGVDIPSSATLRARAVVLGGYNNGSASVLESSVGSPVITAQTGDLWIPITAGATISVTATGSGPLSYQWYKNGVLISSATNFSLNVSAPLPTGDTYHVVVTNSLGSMQSQTIHVWPRYADSFNPDADGSVNALAIQPDGKIVMGGNFTNSPGNRVARVHSDGRRDDSFNVSVSGGGVRALAVQTDGKIVVGGSFTNLAGQTRTSIGRLNADGTLDQSYAPYIDGTVSCLALQPDGKILVGYAPNSTPPVPVYPLIRLNSDGSWDSSFSRSSPYFLTYLSAVESMQVQTDGKIIAGGRFLPSNLGPTHHLVRFDSSGNLDHIYTWGSSSSDQWVFTLALQPDGAVIVGGLFSYNGNSALSYLVRFNSDGILDTAFAPKPNSYVRALVAQADGKILVGGAFSNLAGGSRNGLGRINSDGSLDTAFDMDVAGTNSAVFSLAIQADGKTLVGGSFTTLYGRARKNIGRLSYTAPPVHSLSRNDSEIQWLRGGISSEVEAATLEISSDQAVWTSVGTGTRIPGGWQWSGVSSSPGAMLRARGFINGNSSSWFLEEVLQTAATPPLILLNDGQFGFGTNGFGFSIEGVSGQTFILEGSSDLLDWIPLLTNTFTNAPRHFSDPRLESLPHQYYRTRTED
ncbi:MAG: hypothetical protein H0X66_01655 [Verrucomicrobia bacterium]|nr:hypothetical protein [Verrucomicrobiota bacterium]